MSDTDGIGDLYDTIKSRRFRPKARKQDVELYVESCRTKFGCFETDSSGDDLAGMYVITCGWLGSHDLCMCHISFK